ncbi:uncharacterized protein [Phaseolus vulgaris]|uniref:uncharacterized protein n=1 Tax=Phaseolus vulgaris TaxID=3885 RepID=UPI0035CA4F3D
MWNCDSSKSPGPDGFNFGFLKFCWEIIKLDVVSAVKDFASKSHWPRGSNAFFLCLVPKVENPQQLGEFRPISLVGCLYKIISKALSLRLKKIISNVIDMRQSTFLEGRGLLDSVLVANEVLEEYKRKRKSCVFFKVDYEKAYHSISWDFIYYMLDQLGFCAKWIRWIKCYLESASVSVLVNGSPTREFTPRKGLRQDDPLAPFLFLLVAEGLVGVSRMAKEKNLIDSLEVGRARVKVNMLQYADDTLFFCEANTKSIFNIKAILLCFELASGLKVNFLKSRLDKLVRIQRNFLWGWGSDGRKIAWASWDKVCEPQDFGGLGIIDLRILNLALLGNWIWRLGMDRGGLWKEILDSKYGGWRSLREDNKFNRGSLWWKDLKEVWNSEGWGRSFEYGVKWKVGDGKEISFWEDNWLGCGNLKGVFSRLFSISSAKDAKVAELGYWYNGVWVWNLEWRRSFFNWEKSLVEQLVQLLQEAKLTLGEVRRGRGGEFSPEHCKLWRYKALPSALFTAWRVVENRIASKVNLVRRGVAVENSLCCLCGEEEEEESCHLFFVCRMSQASVSVNDVWGSIWVGIVSEIWNIRNSVIFNSGMADVSEVFASMQVKCWFGSPFDKRVGRRSNKSYCQAHPSAQVSRMSRLSENTPEKRGILVQGFCLSGILLD